jgi:hypothetical protein
MATATDRVVIARVKGLAAAVAVALLAEVEDADVEATRRMAQMPREPLLSSPCTAMSLLRPASMVVDGVADAEGVVADVVVAKEALPPPKLALRKS